MSDNIALKTVLGKDKLVHVIDPTSHSGSTFCGKIWSPYPNEPEDIIKRPAGCPDCNMRVSAAVRRTADEVELRETYAEMFAILLKTQRADHNNLSTLAGKRRGGKESAGSYEFIPHATTENLMTFLGLKNHLGKDSRWSGAGKHRDSVKFIDAGCGVGNVMLSAYGSGLSGRVYGLELFPDTIRQAAQWLGLRKRNARRWDDSNSCGPQSFTVLKENIMTYKNYCQYDVIYYYCPFCSYAKEEVFERYVEDQMKTGAVLVPRLKKNSRINTDRRFEVIRIPGVYQRCYIKIRGGKYVERDDRISRHTVQGVS